MLLARRFCVPGAALVTSHLTWCNKEEETKKPLPVEEKPHGFSEVNLESGPERLLGYSASLARLKIILLKAKYAAAESVRYVAYSSDIGESARPILRPELVNLTYGIAISYVLVDAGLEVRRKHLLGIDNDVLLATGAHRLIFHAAVSLALPAVIIHTAVHQSHKLFLMPVFETMPRVHKYGPTAIGLGIIPFLPILDPPFEYILDAGFDKVFPRWRLGEDPSHHHHKKEE